MSSVTNLQFKDGDEDDSFGDFESLSLEILDDGSYVLTEYYSEGIYKSSHPNKKSVLKYIAEVI